MAIQIETAVAVVAAAAAAAAAAAGLIAAQRISRRLKCRHVVLRVIQLLHFSTTTQRSVASVASQGGRFTLNSARLQRVVGVVVVVAAAELLLEFELELLLLLLLPYYYC